VASFHIGTRALEHFRERGCFLLQSVLLTLTQRTEGASGCKQRSPEVLSTLTKGSTLPDRLGRCHTFEVIGRTSPSDQGHLVLGCGVAQQEENELRVLSYVGRCFPGTLPMTQIPFSR